MSVNRKKLLAGRSQAKAVLASNLSAETKALAKVALDHAEMALGLDDAVKRKRAQQQ